MLRGCSRLAVTRSALRPRHPTLCPRCPTRAFFFGAKAKDEGSAEDKAAETEEGALAVLATKGLRALVFDPIVTSCSYGAGGFMSTSIVLPLGQTLGFIDDVGMFWGILSIGVPTLVMFNLGTYVGFMRGIEFVLVDCKLVSGALTSSGLLSTNITSSKRGAELVIQGLDAVHDNFLTRRPIVGFFVRHAIRTVLPSTMEVKEAIQKEMGDGRSSAGSVLIGVVNGLISSKIGSLIDLNRKRVVSTTVFVWLFTVGW